MGAKREIINEKFKNDDLVRDIKEINRIAKKAEIEKKLVANAADRELDQAKVSTFLKLLCFKFKFHIWNKSWKFKDLEKNLTV